MGFEHNFHAAGLVTGDVYQLSSGDPARVVADTQRYGDHVDIESTDGHQDFVGTFRRVILLRKSPRCMCGFAYDDCYDCN